MLFVNYKDTQFEVKEGKLKLTKAINFGNKYKYVVKVDSDFNNIRD